MGVGHMVVNHLRAQTVRYSCLTYEQNPYLIVRAPQRLSPVFNVLRSVRKKGSRKGRTQSNGVVALRLWTY